MWNDTDTPLAYLITFRTYGTWLHGDDRGSTDRNNNIYRTPHIAPNSDWNKHNRNQMLRAPFLLSIRERTIVDHAIRETCSIRKWHLSAINVRTNHVHMVVSGDRKPELILNAFKSNATRMLKEATLWTSTKSPWADKGSCRRIWNEQGVANAIEYVLNGQGGDLPTID